MLDTTQEWNEYQSGIDYNNRLDYYNKVDLNWRFYNSQQWLGIKTNGLAKWTFNICRSAINYLIAFMVSQKLKMKYSADNTPDEPNPQDPNADQQAKIKQFVELLSEMADMKWEKDKIDSLIKDGLLDGANSGDIAIHVYWDSSIKTGQDETGDFKNELVDGGDIFFGNPNNKIVEKQPYIIVRLRELVSSLKAEAKRNGIAQELIDTIIPDSDTAYQIGDRGKIELDTKGEGGKTTALIRYWKQDGEVYWKKSTKHCPIFHETRLGREKGEYAEETKITRYPIAFANWESVKNSYHGMSATEGIIDNQISINQMFAMVSHWMRLAAFGKVIYDSNRITKWTNQLGEAIAANGDPSVGITGIVHQLQAGNFNEAILRVIDMAIKYTKDFIGASDTLMGQINPEQASGVAIISTTKQASMPLVNITMNRDQLIEDLGLIWGEFFLKKYVNRTVSIRRNGKIVTVPYNAEGLVEQVLLQCKVDVGPSTYWSEIAGIQTLDKLLQDGVITKLQYFERIAKMNIIPDTQGLIEDAQKEMSAPPPEQKDMPNISIKFETLPPAAQMQILESIGIQMETQDFIQQVPQVPQLGGDTNGQSQIPQDANVGQYDAQGQDAYATNDGV